MSDYPHLINITTIEDTQPVYMVGLYAINDELTDEEKQVIARSKKYLKEKGNERNAWLVNQARKDFEKLRDIDGMPEEAISILKRWTTRDEDYDDDDD